MGGNSKKNQDKPKNQKKRLADGGTGLSPDGKRPHSPASGNRARSLELNSRGAVHIAVSSKLAQTSIASYATAAGPAPDKGKGDAESTEQPTSGSQAAFPSLPGSRETPP